MNKNSPPKANEMRARRSANDLIKHYAISSPCEIRLEDIAMDRKVFVREGELKNTDAYLLRKGNKGIIRVRDSIPEVGRKRFAIAHELGHWEMHENDTQLNFCTEENLSDYQGSPMEVEANIFASELLVPTLVARTILGSVSPSIAAAREIANTFTISLTAAAIRLVQLSREDCMAVFSSGGIVKWWRKGKEFSDLPGISKNHILHPESEASEILCGRKPSPKMVRVPNETWFPWAKNRTEFEVYEESIQLGRYSTILTILWIISD